MRVVEKIECRCHRLGSWGSRWILLSEKSGCIWSGTNYGKFLMNFPPYVPKYCDFVVTIFAQIQPDFLLSRIESQNKSPNRWHLHSIFWRRVWRGAESGVTGMLENKGENVSRETF